LLVRLLESGSEWLVTSTVCQPALPRRFKNPGGTPTAAVCTCSSGRTAHAVGSFFGVAADVFERWGEVVERVTKEARNKKHAAQWAMTLREYAAPLRAKRVDEIRTEEVLDVLKPIWSEKPETASRLRGRIEAVLNAARVRGYREGENPARWRGHLDHLLPKPSKGERRHHAAMSFSNVPEFIRALRKREGVAARALELLILTAARTGEVLGARWEEIDFEERSGPFLRAE
jgi:integrase